MRASIHRRSFLKVGGAAAAAMAFSAWRGAPAPAAEPVRIGVMLPLTGRFAVYGPKMERAIKYAFMEVDNKIAGVPVQLFWEDDAGDTTTALDKARKFALANRIRVAIGPITSSITVPLSKYNAEQQIPHIVWHSQPLEMYKAGWSISPYPDMVTSTYITGKYAYEEMGARTAVSIGADYIAGYNFVGGTIMGFEDAGGRVVQKQWAPAGTVDFGPYLAAMRSADITFFWFPAGQTLLFLKQYKEFGLRERQSLAIATGSTILTEVLAGVDEKIIMGLVGATQYSNLMDTPASNKFRKGFRQMWGVEPDDYDSGAYELALLAIKGLEKSGGLASGRQLLEDIKSLDIDAPGGRIRIHPIGYGIRPHHIMKVGMVDGVLVRKIAKSYLEPFKEAMQLRPGVTPGK